MSRVDTLTDKSKMPFGKYEGKAMVDVPASYLIWLYENDKCSASVKNYIKDNIDALKLEVKK